MSGNDTKRLVASFLQFLGDELKHSNLSSDQSESIDVVCQCLHMAFTTTAEDVPAGQKKLMEIFQQHCPAPPKPAPLSEDMITKADSYKQQGNLHMKNENFNEAVICYSKAIDIDPSNAVFYCNRAAAQTGLQKYDLSITDCKKSLEMDPNYSKAHSRMGLTYSKMEMFDEAIACYKKALEMDPHNDGYKKNLQIAEEKQKVQAAAPSRGAMPGMDALGGMGGFLNNPMFMNMAEQMVQNPAMQEMAMKMMSGMMGGGTAQGGSGSQPPDMTQILQMGQQFAQQLSSSNPDLVEQLRGQMPQEDGDKQDENDTP